MERLKMLKDEFDGLKKLSGNLDKIKKEKMVS